MRIRRPSLRYPMQKCGGVWRIACLLRYSGRSKLVSFCFISCLQSSCDSECVWNWISQCFDQWGTGSLRSRIELGSVWRSITPSLRKQYWFAVWDCSLWYGPASHPSKMHYFSRQRISRSMGCRGGKPSITAFHSADRNLRLSSSDGCW